MFATFRLRLPSDPCHSVIEDGSPLPGVPKESTEVPGVLPHKSQDRSRHVRKYKKARRTHRQEKGCVEVQKHNYQTQQKRRLLVTLLINYFRVTVHPPLSHSPLHSIARDKTTRLGTSTPQETKLEPTLSKLPVIAESPCRRQRYLLKDHC